MFLNFSNKTPIPNIISRRQVTIGDSTFKLTPPFLVMATQNPCSKLFS